MSQAYIKLTCAWEAFRSSQELTRGVISILLKCNITRHTHAHSKELAHDLIPLVGHLNYLYHLPGIEYFKGVVPRMGLVHIPFCAIPNGPVFLFLVFIFLCLFLYLLKLKKKTLITVRL